MQLLGATFRGLGFEILLHDLVNPTRSITAIVGGEVTGRHEGMGTTTLVIDLKRRRAMHQDKLNYKLEIGARRFKCTTIPILREPHGIVGAICINIDVNYLREVVLASRKATAEYFRKLCVTDMSVDENILSRSEYDKALAGKRHWQDEGGGRTRERRTADTRSRVWPAQCTAGPVPGGVLRPVNSAAQSTASSR